MEPDEVLESQALKYSHSLEAFGSALDLSAAASWVLRRLEPLGSRALESAARELAEKVSEALEMAWRTSRAVDWGLRALLETGPDEAVELALRRLQEWESEVLESVLRTSAPLGPDELELALRRLQARESELLDSVLRSSEAVESMFCSSEPLGPDALLESQAFESKAGKVQASILAVSTSGTSESLGRNLEALGSAARDVDQFVKRTVQRRFPYRPVSRPCRPARRVRPRPRARRPHGRRTRCRSPGRPAAEPDDSDPAHRVTRGGGCVLLRGGPSRRAADLPGVAA